MCYSIITAFDSNQGIGKHDTLPWILKADMKHFKEKTLNKVIIMGYNTYTSIPNPPLKNRINIVLTKNEKKKRRLDLEGVLSFSNLNSLLEYCDTNYKDVEKMIIGGNSIYEMFKDIADTMYLTRIIGDFNCDTHFPKFPFKQWNVINQSEILVENDIQYYFQELKRKI